MARGLIRHGRQSTRFFRTITAHWEITLHFLSVVPHRINMRQEPRPHVSRGNGATVTGYHAHW